MKWLPIILICLTSAASAQDSAHVAVGNISAWDIEFHIVTKTGDYVQDLRNPYDKDQRTIGVFTNGRLSAYHMWIRGKCYTALPSRHNGGPSLIVSAASCRMYDFFDEQLWVIRSQIERKRLEAPMKRNGGKA